MGLYSGGGGSITIPHQGGKRENSPQAAVGQIIFGGPGGFASDRNIRNSGPVGLFLFFKTSLFLCIKNELEQFCVALK